MLYNPILIWQPGKVGSSTLARSLEKIHIRCIHTHDLLKINDFNSYDKRNHICDRLQPYPSSALDYDTKEFLSNNLKKVKIISLVREPIARDISLYFQYFHTDNYFVYDPVYDNSNLNINQKIINYLDDGIKIGKWGAIFDWFNWQMKEILDIDVYQYPFDKEKGYQIIYQDTIELLLIKTERLNDCEEVIRQFVEAENFKLTNNNVGNQKPYKFVYDEIKKTIRIPEYIIDFYYKGNKAMDHFYTEEEKQNFIKKWTKK